MYLLGTTGSTRRELPILYKRKYCNYMNVNKS